jgi:hypothetical protein
VTAGAAAVVTVGAVAVVTAARTPAVAPVATADATLALMAMRHVTARRR